MISTELTHILSNPDACNESSDLREASVYATKRGRHGLAAYCATKASAVDARKVGRINQALSLERDCDRIYQTLSKRSRW